MDSVAEMRLDKVLLQKALSLSLTVVGRAYLGLQNKMAHRGLM